MTRPVAVLFGAFLMASTLIDFGPNLAWHDQQRIAQLIVLLCLPAISWSTVSRATLAPRGSRFDQLTISIAVFSGIGVVSAFLSTYPRWAFLEWSLLLALVAGTWVLFHIRRTGDAMDDAPLLLAFVIPTALILGRMILVYVFALVDGAEISTKQLSSLGFSNRRFLGQFLTISLPLVCAFAMRAPLGRQRYAALILLAGAWLLAFTSATRGTIFGTAVALVVVIALAGRKGWNFTRWQLSAACAGLAAYALLFLVIPWAAGTPAAIETRLARLSSSSGRYELWGHSLRIAAEHPWFGVGPMHLAHWRLPSHAAAHPHNAMIQVAAEWGIPALCVALLAIIVLVRRTFSRVDRSRLDPVDLALLVAVTGAAAQSFVDGVIVMPVTQTATMVVGGWFAARWFSLRTARG